jgi:hypothetical protein
MVNRRLVFFFLLMLLWHLAHVFEEIWGGFWMIDRLGGLGRFLIVNEILFSIPVVLLYFVLQQRPWAFRLSIVYGAVMILNGLGHNLGTWLTGRYFGGFAGGFTGIGLVAIGGPLVYYLWRAMPG